MKSKPYFKRKTGNAPGVVLEFLIDKEKDSPILDETTGIPKYRYAPNRKQRRINAALERRKK